MSRRAAGAYDSIVIGGGHNGLICATYLARAGRRVLLLEAADSVGGGASTREFAPGFRVSACAHLLHLMPTALMQDLRLERQGLRLAATGLPTVALSQDGAHLTLAPDNLEALAQRSAADAAALAQWQGQLARLARALHPVLMRTPPRLGSEGWRERLALLDLGWRLRRLGQRDMRELLRIGGMCVHDLLEERFSLPLLKGALACDAVLGTNYGPRSPGTVLSLLYRAATTGGSEALSIPVGGLGALSGALAAVARATGVEVRTGALVERILVREDRVSGIVLASGEEIAGATVVSSADPQSTLLKLLGSEHLDAGFVRRVSQLRCRGAAAKLHLALDRLPQFDGLQPQALRARLLVAPCADYIERAYNHIKYDEYSTAPMLEITIPTLADTTLAPAGKHVMSVIVQYAPYRLAAGWQGQRQSFADRVIDTIGAYAPGLRASVQAAELLAPPDIEREFRITGGHWHHVELALDQFLMLRPLPGAAQYQTPMPGLFLCGAGAHPGGGILGLPGRNAARQVLRAVA